jgi:hypothetical protein
MGQLDNADMRMLAGVVSGGAMSQLRRLHIARQRVGVKGALALARLLARRTQHKVPVCLYVCLAVHLHVRPSAYLPVSPFVCLSVCLHNANARASERAWANAFA